MRPRRLLIALGAALALVSCSSSKAGPTTTTSSATTTGTTTATTASATTAPSTANTTVVPAPTSTTDGVTTTAGPATTTTIARGIDDPTYVKLAIDCVYKGDKDGSCQKLLDAGYRAEGNYGLGNSFTQAPLVPLRTDCLAGQQLSCAELDARVAAAVAGDDHKDLLCLSYNAGSPEPADVEHLRTLLGADAPSGVQGGLDVLETNPTDAAALRSIRGYVGPICAE